MTVQLPVHSIDSTVDKTLLPDRVIPVVQWIFQRPPWVMWGGILLVSALLGLTLWWLWRHRTAVVGGLVSLRPLPKLGLLVAAAAAAVVTLGLSYQGYHFVQTDKRFCTGCHIFVPSGQPWVRPDTGSYTLVNRMEGKHDTLNCHACHALKMGKEAFKMVLWMSGVRDSTLPLHAKVPRRVCEGCHVQGDAKETWQAIAATAGHRTHLESDSAALRGKVECLTCHARSAHRFIPADSTCSQGGCHLREDSQIRLGKMAGQSDLHCNACHPFTREVPLLATRDSAASTLRPSLRQCTSCHAMADRLGDFSTERDPHGGNCGMCHNPHTQVKSADALKSCAEAGCHNTWKTIPFHAGAAHRRVAARCQTCHQPHSARVDASDCAGCHQRAGVRSGGQGPPLPFDTLKALQRRTEVPARREPRGKGDAAAGGFAPGNVLSILVSNDSFSHQRHERLPCLTCHSTTSKTSTLTFEQPRGCQICHHQAPATSECSRCHSATETDPSTAISIGIAVGDHPVRERTVAFSHPSHRTLACVDCHTSPVTMEPAPSVRQCQACHDSHHESDRSCATCHRTLAIAPAHQRDAHEACSECHRAQVIAELVPGRSFCLTCHDDAQDHYPPSECSSCHLQSSPEEFRAHLQRAESGK